MTAGLPAARLWFKVYGGAVAARVLVFWAGSDRSQLK
jgi:hypothetical protein